MNTETSTTRARRFVIVGIVVAGVLTAVALTVSSLPSPGPPSARTAPTATPDASKAPDPPLTAETGIPTVPEPFVPAAPSPGGQRTTSEVEQGASPDQAPLTPPPVATALGALLHHITGAAEAETYQPMNVNFGLFPPIPGRTKKADRKKMYTDRAREALGEWLAA